MTTAAWEPYVTTAEAAVMVLHDRGMLGPDTSDGRFAALAAAVDPDQRSHPAVRHFAYGVCERHRAQLAAVGVPLDTIYPEPAPPGYTTDLVRRALGAPARRADPPVRRPPYRPAAKRLDLGGDEGQPVFVLSFPFAAKSVRDMVKLIPGRAWRPAREAWVIPISRWRDARRIAVASDMEITPAAQAVLDGHDGEPDIEEGDYQLLIDPDQKHLIVRAGYVKEVVALLREIPGRRYVEQNQEWWIPARQADHVRAIVETFGLLVHPHAAPLVDQWSENASEMRALSRSEDAELEIPGVVVDLFAYQRAGVAYARRADYRTFIGDDMGLGKTATAIAACELAGKFPVVVVCPSKVEVAWRREIARFTPHRTVRQLTGQKARYVEPADYYVIGWPNVAAWVHVLLAAGLQGMVVDESQYAKEPKAQRTKAVKALSGVGTRDLSKADLAKLGSPVPPDGVRLLTSGTYTMNGTSELIAQLAIMGRLEEFGGHKGLTERYVKLGHLSDAEQRRRRQELHERLRATCLVRRKKKDVLADLPAKLRAFLWVEPDAAVMAEYREAEEELLEYLARKAREAAIELGEDPESAAVMAKMRAQGAQHLVLINVLRQLAAKAKMPAAIEWARTFLAGSDESLIVYGHHRAIVNGIADSLDAPRIMGGMTSTASQQVIDRFQARKDRAVVLAIMAAGVGITLTAASTGLFLEQAWNPGTLYQAEDRMHRIGQVEAVTVFYMLAEGTIDEDMIDLIESKRQEVDDVNDGGDVETWDPDKMDDAAAVLSSSGSIAGDLIERLTRRALAR